MIVAVVAFAIYTSRKFRDAQQRRRTDYELGSSLLHNQESWEPMAPTEQSESILSDSMELPARGDVLH